MKGQQKYHWAAGTNPRGLWGTQTHIHTLKKFFSSALLNKAFMTTIILTTAAINILLYCHWLCPLRLRHIINQSKIWRERERERERARKKNILYCVWGFSHFIGKWNAALKSQYYVFLCQVVFYTVFDFVSHCADVVLPCSGAAYRSAGPGCDVCPTSILPYWKHPFRSLAKWPFFSPTGWGPGRTRIQTPPTLLETHRTRTVIFVWTSLRI